MSSPVQHTTSAGVNGHANPQSNMDSIMDLFGSQPAAAAAPTQSSDPLSGLGNGASQPTQQAHSVYNKNDISVTFSVQRTAQAVQVSARFRNTSDFESLSALNLQAAVPKTQKLQLQAISSSELDRGQEATQQMRVASVQGVSDSVTRSSTKLTGFQAPPARLRLRLKLTYSKGGAAPVTEQVDWSEPT